MQDEWEKYNPIMLLYISQPEPFWKMIKHKRMCQRSKDGFNLTILELF